MKFIKQFLMIGILGLLSSQANAITIGIGYHLQAEDPVAVADLLLKNNIKHVRVDSGTDILTSSLLPQVQAFYNKGIQVTVIIHTSTEAKLHVGENQIGFNSVCPGDQITIENTSKNEAVIQVNALKNYVTDFEILNEPSLVNNVFGQSLVLAPFQSVTPSPGNYSSQYLYQENYRTPCGFTIKAIIRGVYKAVKDNSNKKTILGATDNASVGFLQFIRNTQTTTQKPASDYLPAGSGGVLFDIVGYHTYRNKNQNTLVTDEAFYNDYDTSKSSLGTKTSGGAIGMLKQFALPIHINEFNCNEIYGRDSDFPFDNVSGSQSMNKCLDSINKHLPAIVNSGAVEILDMFQLLDQPGHGYECKDPDNYTGTSQRICPAICLDALPKTNPASKCNENNINYSANLQNPAVWDPPAGNPYSGRIADGETRFGMFYTKFTTALTGSGGTAKLTYSILRNDFSQPKPAFSILKKYADTYNDDTQFITLPNGAVISF